MVALKIVREGDKNLSKFKAPLYTEIILGATCLKLLLGLDEKVPNLRIF